MELIVGLIIFCIVGLAAGAIAAFYMGRQQDLWMNLLIGIIGAMVGGFIARLLGITAYNVVGEVVVATLGAILCLYVWQRVRGDLSRSLPRLRSPILGFGPRESRVLVKRRC